MPGPTTRKKGASTPSKTPKKSAASADSLPPTEEEEKTSSDGEYEDPTPKRRAMTVHQLAPQLIVLTEQNFHQWKLSLIALKYSARWSDNAIDIQRTGVDTWDGTEELSRHEARSRRDSCDVMRLRISPHLQFMIEDIRPGDARGLFLRLSERYSVLTTAAFQTLTKEVNSLTMESTGKRVEEFFYVVQSNHARLMLVTKRPTDDSVALEVIGIFLAGLLSPEFDAVKVYLGMGTHEYKRAYHAVVKLVINHAESKGILQLKRGNVAQVLMLNDKKPSTQHASKASCRFFARGTCNKGKACPYSHSPQDKASTGGGKKKFTKNSFPKGSCSTVVIKLI